MSSGDARWRFRFHSPTRQLDNCLKMVQNWFGTLGQSRENFFKHTIWFVYFLSQLSRFSTHSSFLLTLFVHCQRLMQHCSFLHCVRDQWDLCVQTLLLLFVVLPTETLTQTLWWFMQILGIFQLLKFQHSLRLTSTWVALDTLNDTNRTLDLV